MSFAGVARLAKAWLDAPSDEALFAMCAGAREMSPRVPAERADDWKKLLDGFARDEAAPTRKKRVEGLVRACRMFAKAERDRTIEASPLAWEDPVDRVAGLGPQAREALSAAGVRAVADLVWLLPGAWDDLRSPLPVREALRLAAESPIARSPRVCIAGVVKSASMIPMRGRRAVRVVVADEGDPKATVHAWWFFAAHGVLSAAKAGTAVLLVGRVKHGAGKPSTIPHPDFFVDEPAARVVRPRYPRLGVPEAVLRKAVASAIRRTPELPDPVPAAIARREAMRDARPLLAAVHATGGETPSDDDKRAALERLAWVEAFARVRARIEAESRQGEGAAPKLARDPATLARFVAELGFSPTRAQERAIDAIAKDLEQPLPMRRLLLGDVGTGKTAVALAAAAQCVAAKHQAAFLVPTSILAEQYADAAAPLARSTGARIACLTAAQPAAVKRRIAEQLAAGALDVVVGTHALLNEELRFARLGLVVVDEQHRLGVAQRLALVQKGARPHLLTLSATPIPRTLALALRGELATTALDERPRGRVPVTTELTGKSRWIDVLDQIRACASRGERAFVVAPRIDDDDEDDAAQGAVARAEELARALSPVNVVLVHGAMRAAEKQRAMRAFRSGDAQVLVGTTVIEVGVDVPEATLMVIDGADRFGLAQLHQMRGRVGRGDKPGRCVLVHDEPLGELARMRLEALAMTTDGAAIARADLALRGAGDLAGTRQSGDEPELLYLDPAAPPSWIDRVEKDARAILANDPELSREEHRALAIAARRFGVLLAVREEAG